MMRRSSLNFIIDSISFMNILCLAFTGLIMKYVLPPGTGGLGRRLHEGAGREHIKELWSMSRHEWGDIHFCLAILFIVLMIVHIILHWSWIKNYAKSMTGLSGRHK